MMSFKENRKNSAFSQILLAVAVDFFPQLVKQSILAKLPNGDFTY